MSTAMQTHLELAAVPCARGHVRAVACEQGLADVAAVAELLASELMTNAVRASRDPVRLWVICERRSVTVFVWDSSDGMPVRRDAEPDADGGRGLLLVETLASDWGTRREGTGKTVWARVSR